MNEQEKAIAARKRKLNAFKDPNLVQERHKRKQRVLTDKILCIVSNDPFCIDKTEYNIQFTNIVPLAKAIGTTGDHVFGRGEISFPFKAYDQKFLRENKFLDDADFKPNIRSNLPDVFEGEVEPLNFPFGKSIDIGFTNSEARRKLKKRRYHPCIQL